MKTPAQRRYGDEVLALVHDLARFAPTAENNGATFNKAGVSPSLFRKLRTGERSVSARTHAAIVAELDRRLDAALRRCRDRRARAELFACVARRPWIAVSEQPPSAKVIPARLLGRADDRFMASLRGEERRLTLTIRTPVAVPNFGPRPLGRKIQPRQLSTAINHLLSALVQGRPLAEAAERGARRGRPA